MFTGLVADLGRVTGAEHSGDGVRLTIASRLAGELHEGDSIAVNGVCLTATAIDGDAFALDVVNETLARSALNEVEAEAEVNLELAVRASDRLGGHIVQGHVDGVGEVIGVVEDGFSRRVTVRVGPELSRYIAHKGSIAVNGVSLTVAEVDDASFTVSLIPETLQRTTLGLTGPGAIVNLEVDVIAKYVEKLMGASR